MITKLKAVGPDLEKLENREAPTSIEVTGIKGINLTGLGLGAGVRIAQLEPGRPGLNAPPNGRDTVTHSKVTPLAVFDADKPGVDNPDAVLHRDAHGTRVASLLIGDDLIPLNPLSSGIAPKSGLLSSAIYATPFQKADAAKLTKDITDANPGLTAQQVSKQVANELFLTYTGRAIRHLATVQIGQPSPRPVVFNMSYTTLGIGSADGSAQNALMVDYFAGQYNSLFVTATPNSNQEGWVGWSSAYSDLTVGVLTKGAVSGVYDTTGGVAPPMHGTRSLVDLVAPGNDIKVAIYRAAPNQKQESPVPGTDEGASLATPLVSGTVALLTEFVGKNAGTLPASGAGRNVIKAVLLNSADKTKDELPSPDGTQAMLRTVLGLTGPGGQRKNWSQSDDVKDEYVPANTPNAATIIATRQATPLSPEFGAGALNVGRAVIQLSAGQNGKPLNQPNAPPGAIGWDSGSIKNGVAGTDLFNDPDQGQVVRRKYELPQLQVGQPLSATLVFDRPVTMKDASGAAKTDYEPGHTFDGGAFSKAPPNLDLYLMPKGATKLSEAVWGSTSKESSVEHLYFKMPNEGAKYGTMELYSKIGYELWAISREPQIEVNYGIAWWGVAAKAGGGGGGQGNGGMISGVAWDDADGDGLRGTGEGAYSGVTVRLLDPNNNNAVLDSVQTDWQGGYQFGIANSNYGLADGMYVVEFANPSTTAFTDANIGSDDTIDSDASATTGRTSVITVAGNSIENVDAGFEDIPLGTVSGRAWNDADGNGLQGTTEGGYAGVRVELYNTDGAYAGYDIADLSGYYQFADVAPGTYVVQFETPLNAELSPMDAGSDSLDSDADPATGLTTSFVLGSGGAVVRDVGARILFGSVEGTVYFDEDLDGIQDTSETGFADQEVHLIDSSSNVVGSAMTDSDGHYQFDNLGSGNYTVQFAPDVYWQFTAGGPTQAAAVSPGVTLTADAGLTFTSATNLIEGRVWDDVNTNGLQDSGERGWNGVTLELRLTRTSTLVATTTPGYDGSYSFSWVAPGTYDVKVVTSYTLTSQNQGNDDSLDSDFNTSTLLAAGIVVNDWDFVEDLDVGLVLARATITGRAWVDTNANGIRDGSEGGLGGVLVKLFDTSGNLIATATTTTDGTYTFTNVAPGTFRIQYVLPPEYTFTTQDAGSDDSIDSDADASGYTDYFSLMPGQTLTDWDAGGLGGVGIIPIEI